MKKCPLCNAEYPEHVTRCLLDQTSLDGDLVPQKTEVSLSSHQLMKVALISFSLVPIAGVVAIGLTLIARNGFLFLGFMMGYLPGSLLAFTVGTFFAVKAHRASPDAPQGSNLLPVTIMLGIMVMIACFGFLAFLNKSI